MKNQLQTEMVAFVLLLIVIAVGVLVPSLQPDRRCTRYEAGNTWSITTERGAPARLEPSLRCVAWERP